MKAGLVAIASAIVLTATPVATAHPTHSFDACGANRRHGGACYDNGATYLYGDTVFLRGKVSPPHSRFTAGVWRQRPGSHHWRRVDSVPISDTGRMRWSWRTTRDDADQSDPYHFQFRIHGHGHSGSIPIWVIFGE